MTMPKFEPVAHVDEDDDNKWATLVDNLDIKLNAPLYTADQLTEAYEAGKRDAIPDLVTPEMSAAGHRYYQQAMLEHGDFTPTGMFKAMTAAAPKGEE